MSNGTDTDPPSGATEEDFRRATAEWEPGLDQAEDSMEPGPALALAAVLDRPPPSDSLPPFWHWLYFLTWPATNQLGDDGHPRQAFGLPPIPDRTRMFVGGQLRILADLRTGEPATRRSQVTARSIKTGRTGTMLFVTVRHEIEQHGAIAVVEEQELMYRSGQAAAPSGMAVTTPEAAPTSEIDRQEALAVSPVVLFRFSALTANSHRIHYDWPYATTVEGYPGLVVHGPLLAIAMSGFGARLAPDRTVSGVRYRFMKPTFVGSLCCSPECPRAIPL
jgi:hydroxyacyl-ACP dehydratase HTD2-like protein with hotdog domain